MNQDEQKSGPFIGVIIVIIILAIGGYYFWSKTKTVEAPSPTQASTEEINALEQEAAAISADGLQGDLDAMSTDLQ